MTIALQNDMAVRERNKQLGEILTDERPKLFNFIRRRLPNVEDAEDVLQDVLVDFSENFLLPDSIRQTTAWMYRVARNKIADVFRKKKPQSISSIAKEDEDYWLDVVMVAEQSADDALWNDSLADAIEGALETLPGPQRDVFVLHEIEGCSFKEIERNTGIPMATLNSRKRYAIAALKKELAWMYDEFTN